MTKREQDAKVRELQTIAVEEAIDLANRHGCHEPRRIFIVVAFEELGPDLWGHGSGVGHAAGVVPDTRAMLQETLDKIVVPS
jgi:hypothetical protein